MTTTLPAELRSNLLRQVAQALSAGLEGGPAAGTTGAVRTALEPPYSIRVAIDAGAPCAVCGTATGSGPVGYHGEEAICDLCLLEGSSQLGMVLALIAVVRAYASVEVTSDADRRDALAELGAFARIYETFAAKSGPARRFPPRLSIH